MGIPPCCASTAVLTDAHIHGRPPRTLPLDVLGDESDKARRPPPRRIVAFVLPDPATFRPLTRILPLLRSDFPPRPIGPPEPSTYHRAIVWYGAWQEDAQRLAVRVAQLEKEKAKSDKRIHETRKRATVIHQYRKRNEDHRIFKETLSKARGTPN